LGVSGLRTPLGVDAGNGLALLDGPDLFRRRLWIILWTGATGGALALRQPGGGCAALLAALPLLRLLALHALGLSSHRH
jgi:hypothetical protein